MNPTPSAKPRDTLDPPAPVSLRDLPDLLATLPYQLGFVPHHSLVVVGMHRLRVVVTARVDLPPAEDAAAVVRMLLDGVQRSRPDTLLAVLYPGPSDAVTATTDALEAACARRGLDLAELIGVREDRWRDLRCTDPGCCPPQGHPMPDPTRVPAVATFVGLGINPLPDRESVVAQVLPSRADDDPRAAAVQAAVDAARGTLDPWGAASLRTWRGFLASATQPQPSEPTDDEVAVLAGSLTDPMFRDVLIGHLSPQLLPPSSLPAGLRRLIRRRLPGPTTRTVNAHGQRLLALARAVPDGCPVEAAEVLAVVAAAHYGWGEATLARAALDRSLRLHPQHRLSLLLATLIDAAIPPGGLPGGVSDHREERPGGLGESGIVA